MDQAALGLERGKVTKGGFGTKKDECYSRAVGRRGDGIMESTCSVCNAGEGRAANDLDRSNLDT
jgi:hypothetical protein